MTVRQYHVLFLCTGNSARSIMAESLLRHWGGNHFVAYSAGSFPKGMVHPVTLEVLERLQLPMEGLHSKSWDTFTGPDAPQFDFIFTVCDQAARESCPVWAGHPLTAHWGVRDPASETRSSREQLYAFRRTLLELENRIKAFIKLPLNTLDRAGLRHHLDAIGRMTLIPKD